MFINDYTALLCMTYLSGSTCESSTLEHHVNYQIEVYPPSSLVNLVADIHKKVSELNEATIEAHYHRTQYADNTEVVNESSCFVSLFILIKCFTDC